MSAVKTMSTRQETWNRILKRRNETIRRRRAPLPGQDQGKDRPRRTPREGQDARTGQFVKGNRLSLGRPRGALGIVKTYGAAVSRAVPPEKLFQVIEKAVQQALGDGPHCDAARLFILKVLGVDAIRMVINMQSNGSAPGATYDLSLLTDEEMILLDQLSEKMIAPSNAQEQTIDGELATNE